MGARIRELVRVRNEFAYLSRDERRALHEPKALPPPGAVSASLGVMSVSSTLLQASMPTYVFDRATAMRTPTIARARNVLVSTVAVLPIRYWQRMPVGVDDRQVEPREWMLRPDPNQTAAYMLAWTVDDLFFHELAYWRVTDRYPTGLPRAFQWMPFCQVSPTFSGSGLLAYVTWNGNRVPLEDLVVFRGIASGLLCAGVDALTIARKLDVAAMRFADMKLPAGIIELPAPEGYEPRTVEQLNEIGDNFETRRESSVTAVLEGASYVNPDWNAERLQLIESRLHQSTELARVAGVPAWTVNAPTNSSMTYSNSRDARRDLLDFGVNAFMTPIAQTLSGPNVVQTGTYIDFDEEGWLALADDTTAGAPMRKPTVP